jgi:hypothetical protein
MMRVSSSSPLPSSRLFLLPFSSISLFVIGSLLHATGVLGQGYAGYGGAPVADQSGGVSHAGIAGNGAGGPGFSGPPRAPIAPPRVPLPYDAVAEEAEKMVGVMCKN